MSGYAPSTERSVRTKRRPRVKPPRLFRVLLHNDHYTTMDFVVQILQAVFHKGRSDAVRIMLNVHHSGVGVCGIYPFEIAETKVAEVHKLAAANGFPLKCSLEPD